MLARFVPFELERLLATWENQVEYNVSESGVHPLTLHELFGGTDDFERLGEMRLGYPQANGTLVLRERIAALYPGARVENVLVTVGGNQAATVALLALTNPGDRVAVLQPAYQQLWGLAQNLGRDLVPFHLRGEGTAWSLDRDALERATRPSPAMVAIVNPNNPTGYAMRDDERRATIDAAASAGAWLLADEVYAGAERTTDACTPTFYGSYAKVLAVNSLSKSYSLPGLRLGWIVGPAEAVERMWAWQDYLTICAAKLGNEIAAYALLPEVRSRIFARSRAYVRRGFAALASWASSRRDVDAVAPDAGSICVVRYRAAIGSTDLAMCLVRDQSVLVAPGETFGIDGCFRIGFALPEVYLNEGLRRIGIVLDELAAANARV